MQLDFTKRELTIKLVYYGPALSGKTTNLQALHATAVGDSAGRLMTLDTKDDRTLFFDLLPLSYKDKSGLTVKLKVFTVPGQVIHSSTRRLVVQGADGVIFVADSRESETEVNAAAFIDLKDNLESEGLSLETMPLIIQFNKRDLPGVRPVTDIADMARRGSEPVFLAVATRGEGVVESFVGLLHLTWQALEREHGLAEKFKFDGEVFVQDVLRQLGREESLVEILDQSLSPEGFARTRHEQNGAGG